MSDELTCQQSADTTDREPATALTEVEIITRAVDQLNQLAKPGTRWCIEFSQLSTGAWQRGTRDRIILRCLTEQAAVKASCYPAVAHRHSRCRLIAAPDRTQIRPDANARITVPAGR